MSSDISKYLQRGEIYTLIYNTINEININLITGKTYTEHEKKKITEFLLNDIEGYIDNNSNNINVNRRQPFMRYKSKNIIAPNSFLNNVMYPLFYIPPLDKIKSVPIITGGLPKTFIVAANHYELETLRILFMWCKNNQKVNYMIDMTKERLESTCFGNYCGVGECFDASVIALRFYNTVYSGKNQHISHMLSCINKNMDKMIGVSKGILYYLYLTLSEIETPEALEIINKYSDKMFSQYNRGFKINNDNDKIYKFLYMNILKNCLQRLPFYEYLKDGEIYINGNNKCVFSLSENKKII